MKKNSSKVHCCFELSIDGYNHKCFGWEPFVEPWSVKLLEFTFTTSQNQLEVELQSGGPYQIYTIDNKTTKVISDEVLDFNITLSCIEELRRLHTRWPLYQNSLSISNIR